MKRTACLIAIGLILFYSRAFPITPEDARKELAQENIPYTSESFFTYIGKGNAEVLNWFLAIGINVDTKNEFGETGLVIAAEEGYQEIVRLLLDHNADVDSRDLAR
ncbi:MAG: ankyrin repeat domain-containing protein, partial [Desulfobacterales bacterium]